MKILITGIGDAYSARHFGSSALIQAPDGHVLIDCPDPIHRVLRQATEAAGWNVDAADIDDIIITHLHGDHCNGLESFGFRRQLVTARDSAATRPRIHTTPPVADLLWQRLSPAMGIRWGNDRPMILEDYFDVRLIDPDHEARIAGLIVRCRFTKHPIPTVGLLLNDGASILGWSGDTPFEPAHLQWLDQARLIVHESNLGDAHTPIESLNALPEAMRAKIRLIHLPDDFDASATDMRPLREGEVLDLM
jgi:ribonuclease BN (tRNA processing enzyme)